MHSAGQAAQYIRLLKGPPLAVLAALRLTPAPLRSVQLIALTGYTDKPVRAALERLALLGLAHCLPDGVHWQATARAAAWLPVAPPADDTFAAPDAGAGSQAAALPASRPALPPPSPDPALPEAAPPAIAPPATVPPVSAAQATPAQETPPQEAPAQAVALSAAAISRREMVGREPAAAPRDAADPPAASRRNPARLVKRRTRGRRKSGLVQGGTKQRSDSGAGPHTPETAGAPAGAGEPGWSKSGIGASAREGASAPAGAGSPAGAGAPERSRSGLVTGGTRARSSSGAGQGVPEGTSEPERSKSGLVPGGTGLRRHSGPDSEERPAGTAGEAGGGAGGRVGDLVDFVAVDRDKADLQQQTASSQDRRAREPGDGPAGDPPQPAGEARGGPEAHPARHPGSGQPVDRSRNLLRERLLAEREEAPPLTEREEREAVKEWLMRGQVAPGSVKMRELLALRLSLEYVKAFVLHWEHEQRAYQTARKQGQRVRPPPGTGLMINRMLDGEPPPPSRCEKCLELPGVCYCDIIVS